MGEAVPKTWEEARALVADRIQTLTTQRSEDRQQLDALRAEVGGLARSMRLAAWVVSLVVAAVGLASSTAIITASRHYTQQALQPAALSAQERIEEIADVLHDIGRGPGERRVNGRPTVAAVRRALPMVRGVKSDEITAACQIVDPAVCKP